MAGKLRIKVLPADKSFHVEPFWMFIDREESPLIINIEEKIKTRLKDDKPNVKVKSLYLDGCRLPTNETSELLRDSDMIQVKFAICKDDGDQASSVKPCGKNRKRKNSDTTDVPLPDIKRKKKDKGKTSEDSKPSKDKKSKEKCKQKFATKQKQDPAADNDDGLTSPKLSAPTSTNNTNESETQNKISNTQMSPVTKESSETAKEIVHSIPKADTSVEKPKRRRRQKKKSNAKDQPDTGESSAKTQTVAKQTPAELRLPEWQKNQNKRVVFLSENESEGESSVAMSHTQGVADRSQDASGLVSSQPGVSDSNSSFNESFPSKGALKSSKAGLVQKAMKKGAGTKLAGSSQVPDTSMRKDMNGNAVNGSAETENICQEDEWLQDWQHQEKINDERYGNHHVSSALDKASSPALLYTSGHHPLQVEQPNLSEHLKKSPGERGVAVPPQVTAKRLSNGAMLYTRSPRGGVHQKPASPAYKQPAAAYTPVRDSPFTLSKQQQLDTISTNRSIIIQNPPSSSIDVLPTETGDIRHWIPSSGEGPEFSDVPESAETIILTPVRKYSLFADLIASPKQGDLIAYKVLEVGEDYTPGISDYKEAEVLAYHQSTQNVTLKLTQRRSKKKAVGKFDLSEDGEEEDEVTLELSSMFEPKLISSSGSLVE